jgi:hypothetical protein
MSALQVLERIRDEAITKMNAFISGLAEKAEKTEAVTAEVVETVVGEVAAEAAAATGTVISNGQAKSRKGWKGGVNKSELVRNYFEKHGMDCRNKDLIDAIRKSKGVELNPTLVSIIRKSMGSKRVRKTRAQKVALKVVKKASKTRTADLAGLPMTALCARILQKARGREGLKLAEIADLVIQSGYKYTGSKGREGVVQNVYQALHNLSKKTAHPGYEGQVAVILKDETSHRYRLNPKAKTKKVA